MKKITFILKSILFLLFIKAFEKILCIPYTQYIKLNEYVKLSPVRKIKRIN